MHPPHHSGDNANRVKSLLNLRGRQKGDVLIYMVVLVKAFVPLYMVTLADGFVPLYRVTLKRCFERIILIEDFATPYAHT